MLKGQEKFIDVKSPGIVGWNNFSESEAIGDQESADVDNIIFNGGFASPRPGSELFAAKPSGESADPLQLITANTSDGIEYIISVYGASFYLRNEITNQWVKINQTYTPTETTTIWGYINWNNGRGDDRLYACNGIDHFFRWNIAVTTVGTTASTGAATVTVTDGTRFPTSGTLIIGAEGSEHKEAYTSRTGNVFTLTGTLSADITAGDSVTSDIIEKGSMELGKILGKHQSRLVVANKYGAETAGWYTVTNDPEDFTTGSSVTDASTFVIADGNGEIKGLHDFGKFLVIEKSDSLHELEIVIDSTLGSKLDKITPIISGSSVGPVSQESTVKASNKLYYPTSTEGFISLDPQTSGTSTSTGLTVLSEKIQPFVTNNIDLSSVKGINYKQNILWAVARTGATKNTYVLVYDMLRNSWSKFTSWAVIDWAKANKNLYYLENGSGDVIRCYTKTFNDLNNPYKTSFFTKRYNFGVMSEPKTASNIYVQGYMTPTTELYAEVLFNEGGILDSQTFKIIQGAEGLLYSQPLTNTLGEPILGTVSLGYVDLIEIGDLSFFRTYLGINVSNGFYNLQVHFYSNKESFWGITGVGFNPELMPVTDPSMVMSPILST